MNILFICSKNKWRSRTAETIFKNRGHDTVKSAGTDKNARVKVNGKLLEWADVIFVMEDKHKDYLKKTYPNKYPDLIIHVLGIEDQYLYMDNELIELLKITVEPLLFSKF